MKKRLMASLLTLCMVLTLLPAMTPAAKAAGTGVWVNGVDLSAGIATNCGGGTATYNAGTNTLTLNGATITQTHIPDSTSPDAKYGIYANGDLIINLEGNNSLTLATDIGGLVEGNLTFSGNGSLTMVAYLGLNVMGSVTVQSSVHLDLTVSDESAIASPTVTFAGVPYTGRHKKLIYNGDVLSFPLSALYVNGVDMLGSATKPNGVTFVADTSTLTLNGATINTICNVSGVDKCGIYADSNLTIHLVGKNTITLPKEYSYGIEVKGELAFTGNSGSSLTVNTSSTSIYSVGALTVDSGVTLSATTTQDNFSNAIYCYSTSAATITIKSGATVTAMGGNSAIETLSMDGSISKMTIEAGAKVTAKIPKTGPDAFAALRASTITIGGVPYSGKDKEITYDGVKLPFLPKVVSVYPRGTSTPTFGSIVITFDMPMKTGEGTVKLNEHTALTGGIWSNENKTYTIPYSDLLGSTLYTVKIENFQGATGNLLAIDSAHSFTTTKKAAVSDKISLAIPDLTYNGQEQDCGDATLSITPIGTPHWTYKYTAKPGGTLGYTQKPLGAGDYTVTVTYNDDESSGEKTFDFTVKKANAALILETTDKKTAYTYGEVIPFKVTANPAAVIGTAAGTVDFKFGTIGAGSAYVVKDNAVAYSYATAGKDVPPGDYTVTVSKGATDNYNATSGTLPLKLNAKSLTATAAKVYDGTKGFTNAALTLGEIVSEGSVSDDVTAAASFDTASEKAGSYTVASPAVTLAGTRQAYYAAPASVAVTITAKTVSTPTITAAPATYVQTGSAIIPTSVVVKDGDKVIDPSEYTLSYSNNTDAGEATITVTDKDGGNYTVSGTGHFTITAKTAVTVNMDTIALTDKTYDGTAIAYTGAAAGTHGESTPYAGGFTYEWYEGGNKLTEAPKAAGSYTLKATVNDSNYAGVGAKDVTIAKRAATITADNKEMLIGATEPDYTATTSNLASGESISSVNFTVTNKSTAQKGNYTIVPAGGIITGGNANYTISYVDGTLAVKVDVTAIDTAIAAANLAKTGVTANEGEPSAVASGTKFVKQAVLDALNSAIQTATAAKATVGNAQQAADAATVLDGVVSTFTAAIKTGTYVAPSGGGTVTPPVPKPEPPKTDPGTGNTEVSVPVKPVTKGDTSSATVPEKSVSDAIAAAEKEAAKTGGSSSVTITVDAPKGAKTVETTLPSKSLSAVAEGKTEGLKISTPVADLSFDSEALKNIAGMAGKDVKISATQVDATALTDAQKSQVGDAPVFDFTVTSGDKTISNFNGGTATVSVPYTPKDGENPEFVTVWLLDDAGKLIPIEAKYKDGKIAFETGHFSRYAIGYLPFTDVKPDWAYESIVYVYQNKLFSGVGNDKFAPTDNMNRAMLWTVLYRMAGSPDKTETPANWYADAQAWAIANGISDGTNPDGNVTREQLATILWRYAQSKKQDVSIGEDTNILSYDDFDQMSQYAIPALQWACGAGVITGKSDSVLDPAGNATRAEVAAMLQRYAGLNK